MPLVCRGNGAEAFVDIGLRRATTLVDASSPEDDFDVMDGKRRIGRVYSQQSSAMPWRWSLSQFIAAGHSGRAATRVEALVALTRAYNNALVGEVPARQPRSLRATLLMHGETAQLPKTVT
jgi:hypothetical protein